MADTASLFTMGDVVLQNPKEAGGLFAIVVVLCVALESIIGAFRENRSRYVKLLFLQISEEIMIVGVIGLCFVFVSQSISTLPLQWLILLRWIQTVLFFLMVFFIIGIVTAAYFSLAVVNRFTAEELAAQHLEEANNAGTTTTVVVPEGVDLTMLQRLYFVARAVFVGHVRTVQDKARADFEHRAAAARASGAHQRANRNKDDALQEPPYIAALSSVTLVEYLKERAKDTVVKYTDISLGHSESIRQTWQIDFDVICDSCRATVAKGTKVYANVRRLREKYLKSVAVYELSIKCPLCSVNEIVFVTDPEHATYRVVTGGRRASGGFQDWAAKAKEAASVDAVPDAVKESVAEHAERIERHQQAIIASEEIDQAVEDDLQRLFFPSSEVIKALQEHEEQVQRNRLAAIAAAKNALLSEAEIAAAHEEFHRLRAARGYDKRSSAAVAQRDVAFPLLTKALGSYAGVVMAPDLIANHDAMIARFAAQFQAEPPQSIPTPQPLQAAPSAVAALTAVQPKMKKGGSLLAALADY